MTDESMTHSTASLSVAPAGITDGYYWFRCVSAGGTLFVAYREGGHWYVPAVAHSVNLSLDNLVGPIAPPDAGGLN